MDHDKRVEKMARRVVMSHNFNLSNFTKPKNNEKKKEKRKRKKPTSESKKTSLQTWISESKIESQGKKRPVNAFKYCVALRMCHLWYIFEKHTTKISPTFKDFAYYIGIAMDIHVFGLKDCCSLQELYLKKMAPELIKIESLVHDSHSTLEESLLEQYWVSDVSYAEEKKSSKKMTTKVRKPNFKNPNTMLPMDVNKKKPKFKHQRMQSLMEMINKGKPNQSVVRYVLKSFVTGLVDEPENNPVIIEMVRMFFLGSYQHCNTIAPPFFRLFIYSVPNKSAFIFYNLLKSLKLTARQLYYILCEFIVANTNHNPPLVSMLEKTISWNAYSENATYYCDQDIRQKMYPCFVQRKKPKKYELKIRQPSQYRLFRLLVSILDIKYKVPPKRLKLAIDGIGFKDLYNAFHRQPDSIKLYWDILVQCGLPEDDLKKIANLFSDTPYMIMKRMKSVLESLSCVAYHRLALYVHYIFYKSSLIFLPIQAVRKTRKEPVWMLVCKNCFTIRSQCATEKLHKRSKPGIEVDFVINKPRCSGCKSDMLQQVDMRHWYVYGIALNDNGKPNLYTMCHRCGVICNYKHVIGQYEFCNRCMLTQSSGKDLADVFVLKRCICGKELDDRKRYHCINALNEDGALALYGLCSDHAYLRNTFNPSKPESIKKYRSILSISKSKKCCFTSREPSFHIYNNKM